MDMVCGGGTLCMGATTNLCGCNSHRNPDNYRGSELYRGPDNYGGSELYRAPDNHGGSELYRDPDNYRRADIHGNQEKEKKKKKKKPIRKLEKVQFKSVAATSKGTVELRWSRVSGANQYEIYRKKKGQEKYKLIARTKKTKYEDKKGRRNVTYVYRVKAVRVNAKKCLTGKGRASRPIKCKVRKKNPKIAYAGDSIMTGFTCYHILSGRKNARVFAAVGMSTGRFPASKEMQALLQYNPDRLYIMLGVNSLWTDDTQRLYTMWNEYDRILRMCRNRNPHMEIIVVEVTPVGRNSTISNRAVYKFNSILKEKVSKKTGMYYCDVGDSLSDSSGYLLSQYSAGDGVHWKSSTYYYVLKQWDKFAEKIYWYK